MTIGVDIRCLMNSKYSGVSLYTLNLLMALIESDQTNQYKLFYNSAKPVALPEFKAANVELVSYHWPNKLFNFSLNFFNRPRLDKLVGGCDIFFLPNLSFAPVSDSRRLVLTIHDLSFLAYPAFFNFKQRLWHKLILQKGIINRADQIITDSLSTKNDLVDLLGVRPEKITVVYLGVENKYFNCLPDEELARIKNKYKLPKKFFLFVGTIEPRKNLLGLIEAWQPLKDRASLVLAGAWGWKNQEIKKLKNQEYSTSGGLLFLDYVDEADKPALYQLATALAFPSFYEGFGLPVLEAMAMGVPVVCSNTSSLPEVAGVAALYADPNNIGAWTHQLAEVLKNKKTANELRERGLARAKEFSWEKTAAATFKVYREALT